MISDDIRMISDDIRMTFVTKSVPGQYVKMKKKCDLKSCYAMGESYKTSNQNLGSIH